jgi:hypothetical protein
MAYMGIDHDRLKYLIRKGVGSDKLLQFYNDCRLQLVAKGAKIQNKPPSFPVFLEKVINFPSSTDKIVKNWFSKNITIEQPAHFAEIIYEFKRYEGTDEDLPENYTRRLSRSCLVHIFSDNPPQELVDFLRTPITAPGVHMNKQKQSENINKELNDTIPAYPEDKVDREKINEVPSELANIISALQEAKKGNTLEAKDAIEKIPADSIMRTHLEELVRQQEKRQNTEKMNVNVNGLQIITPEIFEGDFDYDSDEVLADCTKADKSTAVFVRPLAVIVDKKINLLDDEKRKTLFPETGNIQALLGHGCPRQPHLGEIGIWRVAEHQTDRSVHYHLTSEKKSVYEVQYVPLPSNDYDSVREYLKEWAETSNVIVNATIFQLTDGLIVSTRTDRPDLTKDETYEQGLRMWNSLPAIKFDNKTYVPGPLPKEHGMYECASLASTAKLLFKKWKEGGKIPGGITKDQFRELNQSLNAPDIEVDSLRIQRITAQLEKLTEQQDAFDTLVNELMNHADVKHRIAQLVEQESSKQLASKSTLQADIARLQTEKGNLEERIRKQREEDQKLPEALSKAVKKRFDKARKEGLETLADMAIFQAISAPAYSTNIPTEGRTDYRGSFAEPIVREFTKSTGDSISILNSFGVTGKKAAALELTCKIAFKAGLVVCIQGIAARPAVEGWVKTLNCSGVIIDSTVGLIDDTISRNVLAKGPEVLTIFDANLSALDIYAKSLSDLVIERISKPQAGQFPEIFLVLSDSVGALPLPRTFERISVLLDLDAHYVFYENDNVEDGMSELFDTDEGILYQYMWRPAAEQMKKQIKELEAEHQALVLSILNSTR